MHGWMLEWTACTIGTCWQRRRGWDVPRVSCSWGSLAARSGTRCPMAPGTTAHPQAWHLGSTAAGGECGRVALSSAGPSCLLCLHQPRAHAVRCRRRPQGLHDPRSLRPGIRAGFKAGPALLRPTISRQKEAHGLTLDARDSVQQNPGSPLRERRQEGSAGQRERQRVADSAASGGTAAGTMAPTRLSPAVLLLWLALCVVAQCSVALFGVASRWLQVRQRGFRY